jgi:hypothetical protein
LKNPLKKAAEGANVCLYGGFILILPHSGDDGQYDDRQYEYGYDDQRDDSGGFFHDGTPYDQFYFDIITHFDRGRKPEKTRVIKKN